MTQSASDMLHLTLRFHWALWLTATTQHRQDRHRQADRHTHTHTHTHAHTHTHRDTHRQKHPARFARFCSDKGFRKRSLSSRAPASTVFASTKCAAQSLAWSFAIVYFWAQKLLCQNLQENFPFWPNRGLATGAQSDCNSCPERCAW